jgi:prevent-host-death family protein
MNKIVTAAEVGRSLSKLLNEARQGQEITVTSHGRPIARIVPPTDEAKEKEKAARDHAWQKLMDSLRTQPAMNKGPWSREEAYDDDLK